MADFRIRVYLISVEDLKKLMEKFPVFACAELSERAKKEGAFEDSFAHTGWYFTRNKAENGWVIYVGFYGGLVSYSPACDETGLRIGMNVLYDPESDIVKSLHPVKRKGIVWDPKTKTRRRMKGVAPVVTFGDIEYIWLNQEDCVAGTAKTMELVSLKLVCKAEPFDRFGVNNDFDLAGSIHSQMWAVATEKLTGDEKNSIVPTEMFREDNFMTARPIVPEMTARSEENKTDSVQTKSLDGEGK